MGNFQNPSRHSPKFPLSIFNNVEILIWKENIKNFALIFYEIKEAISNSSLK